MRVLVVSRNRLAGLGLVTLAQGSGLPTRVAGLDEACGGGRGVELVLLYCDGWDGEARQAADLLRQAHVRFLAVAGHMGPEERRQILAAGAVNACLHADAEELSLILANYRWSAATTSEQIALANGFVVDLPRRRVQRGARFNELTLTECRILSKLRDEAQNRPHCPVALLDITHTVWGAADARSLATLRGHVSQLRSKVEVDPDNPSVLRGRRGRGYWLELLDRPSA